MDNTTNIPDFNEILEKAQHEMSFKKADAKEFIRIVDELTKLRDSVYRHNGILYGTDAANVVKYLNQIKDFAGKINVKSLQ